LSRDDIEWDEDSEGSLRGERLREEDGWRAFYALIICIEPNPPTRAATKLAPELGEQGRTSL